MCHILNATHRLDTNYDGHHHLIFISWEAWQHIDCQHVFIVIYQLCLHFVDFVPWTQNSKYRHKNFIWKTYWPLKALQELSHSTIHTHRPTLMAEVAMQGAHRLIRSNLEFSILPKDTNMQPGDPEIEPQTFRLVNDLVWPSITSIIFSLCGRI